MFDKTATNSVLLWTDSSVIVSFHFSNTTTKLTSHSEIQKGLLCVGISEVNPSVWSWVLSVLLSRLIVVVCWSA